MKQSSIIILLTMLMSMVCPKTFAEIFSAKNADGVNIYYLISGNNELEVSVSYPSGAYHNSQNYSGKVVIPESVDYKGKTYKVTSIRPDAFFDCKGLTSVTIPKSVTSYYLNAFYGCSGLTSVHISDLEAWCNMVSYSDLSGSTYDANPLRYAHHLFLNGKEITDLIIPNGVSLIYNRAFEGCSGLTSVIIPNSVTAIGKCAFRDCSGLKSVTIPNNVLYINEYAFDGCSSLESITIPQSVTNIASSAFDCKNLKSIISEIKQPFKIETNVFGYKPNACLIVPKGTKSLYQTTDGWNKIKYIVEAGEGGEIGQTFEFEGFSFKICENNTDCAINGISMVPEELEIPAQVTFNGKTYNVTSIGGFKDCVNITSVTIPNSVTSIGESAFWGCNGLTSISIPENVTSIGDGAFRYCKGLTSISIPNSVNSIGNYVFQGCSNLTSATISNNVTSIGTRAFEDCSSLTSITIPKGLTTIGDYAFSGCKGLTSITIPNNIISIGNYAFQACSGLTSIIIPNSVTSIGEYNQEIKGVTNVEIIPVSA